MFKIIKVGGLVAAACLIIWLTLAPPAQAHAIPVTTNPRANAILENSPPELSIQFSEPVVPNLSRITLLTQAGQSISTGELVPSNDNSSLRLSLPPLNNGTYLVSWHVLSAVDGHTTSGSFSFGVGVTSLGLTSVATDTSVRIAPMSITARWGTLLGVTLLLGLYAFRLFILPEKYPLTRTHLRLPWLGLIFLGVGLILTLLDQSSQYDLWQMDNFRTWLGTRFGQMWLLRLLLTGANAYLLVIVRGKILGNVGALAGTEEHTPPHPLAPSPPLYWLGLLLSLGLGLTSSMVSHSAALRQGSLTATLIDLAHLAAAAIWIGALLQLALTLWQGRHLPDEARSRLNLELNLNFSGVGAAAVGILILSGSFLAYTHVASWSSLVGTHYGLTLLAKVALTLPTFFIASLNLLVIKPKLAERSTPPTILRRFSQLVRLETAIAILILLAAGILIELQRAADAPLLADDPGRLVVEQTVDDLTITLAIEPALIGNNTFDIFLTDAQGNPIADASRLLLRYTFLGQSLGADEGQAMPHDDGHYQLQGSYISLIGEWQVEIAIRRPGHYDTFAPFRLEAGLGGTIRPLASQETSLGERFARFMTIMGGGVAGIFFLLFGLGWLFLARQAAHTPAQLIPLVGLGAFMILSGGNMAYIFFSQNYTPGKFLTNPILPDSQSITIGETIYREDCVVCHGPMGLGDGPGAVGLNPAPVNFAAGHTATHSDGDLFYWIKNGVRGSAMPGYGEKFSDEEMWHLVNYVRRLSMQSFP